MKITNLTLVIPIGYWYENKLTLLGSCTLIKYVKNHFIFVTAHHLFGDVPQNHELKLLIPNHNGDFTAIQKYPIVGGVRMHDCEIIMSELVLDLTFIKVRINEQVNVTEPVIIDDPEEVNVMTDVAVLSYPFALAGSTIETMDRCVVSAKCERIISSNVEVSEFMTNSISHPGTSGGALIRLNDWKLVGIVRGSLSPKPIASLGHIPFGTDSSVTITTSAHYIHEILNNIIEQL